jgi:hypothetical protein
MKVISRKLPAMNGAVRVLQSRGGAAAGSVAGAGETREAGEAGEAGGGSQSRHWGSAVMEGVHDLKGA